MSMTYFTYNSSAGPLTIATNGQAVTQLAIGKKKFRGTEKPHKITNNASTELQEYLAGRRTNFNVPLDPVGTDFQKMVWDTLRKIPYGQMKTYTEIAEMLGSPNSYRVVSAAINKNPIPILIPTHRVISVSYRPASDASSLDDFLISLERENVEHA